MAGLDDQVTYCPALVVHYKVFDVADRSVAGLNLIAAKVAVAAKSLRASQMRIAATVEVATPACLLTRLEIRRWKTTHAPHSLSVPVRRPSIVTIILLFILSRDWIMRLHCGTVFNLLPRQINEQAVAANRELLVAFPT